MTYVGTANYRNVVQDPVFIHSLLNNLKLLLTVPVMTVLALRIALLLNAGMRGWRAVPGDRLPARTSSPPPRSA